MKKLISIISCFVLLVSFCGCSLVDNSTQGKVYAVSGDFDFEAYSVKVAENGELLPGYDMSSIVSEMDADVPYNDDFMIKLEGTVYGNPTYAIYSEELENYYENAESLTIPEAEGTKIVKIRVTWGDEDKNASYDYFFKLIR